MYFVMKDGWMGRRKEGRRKEGRQERGRKELNTPNPRED